MNLVEYNRLHKVATVNTDERELKAIKTALEQINLEYTVRELPTIQKHIEEILKEIEELKKVESS